LRWCKLPLPAKRTPKPLSVDEESGVRKFYKSDAGRAFLAKRKEFGETFETIRKASTKDLSPKIMESIRRKIPSYSKSDKPNKMRHPTTTSLSVSMTSSSFNLNPEFGVGSR